MLTPELLKKILAVKEEGNGDAALALLGDIVVQYATGDTGEGEPPPDPTAAAKDPDPEAEAMTALSRDVIARTGAKSAGEAATRVKVVFDAHEETEKRARTLEASEYRSLTATLVQIGAETPATAWQKNAEGEIGEGDARTPVKRLADEPIAELRSRVEALAKANPTRSRIAPPVVKDGDETKLSDYDRKKAAEIKDPEKRAKFVGMRLAKGNK